jgi:AcrR family transcriptional regulator
VRGWYRSGSSTPRAGGRPPGAGIPERTAPAGVREYLTMDADEIGAPAADGPPERAGYRRSAGSARGEARRLELLDRVTDDLAENGLVGFSLRRAARAAGTTHKVLLYHFAGAEDLLAQAIVRLRDRRIGNALGAAVEPGAGTLAGRIRAVLRVLINDESGLRVIDQAMGLTMYDPVRYAGLGREAAGQYLPALLSICPADWSDQRKLEVSAMLLAVLRGFVVDWRTTGETARIEAGLEALLRALEREESAPPAAPPAASPR